MVNSFDPHDSHDLIIHWPLYFSNVGKVWKGGTKFEQIEHHLEFEAKTNCEIDIYINLVAVCPSPAICDRQMSLHIMLVSWWCSFGFDRVFVGVLVVGKR